MLQREGRLRPQATRVGDTSHIPESGRTLWLVPLPARRGRNVITGDDSICCTEMSQSQLEKWEEAGHSLMPRFMLRETVA